MMITHLEVARGRAEVLKFAANSLIEPTLGKLEEI